MMSEKAIHKIIDRYPADPIPHQEGRPYILLDGALKTAHNVLAGLTIGRAAQEVHNLNVGYLCWREDPSHYCDQLYRKAGVVPVEWGPYAERESQMYKLWARLQAEGHGLLRGKKVLGLKRGDIDVSDLIYDDIVRYNEGVVTITDASRGQIAHTVNQALRQLWAIDQLCAEVDVHSIVVSHKTYLRYGIPLRVAFAHGAEVLSRKHVHINRITQRHELNQSDFYLTRSQLDDIVSRLGGDALQEYANRRFKGESNNYNELYAFQKKRDYEAESLVKQMGLNEGRPIAMLAPHIYSDEPHYDRTMIHPDYFKWLEQTLEITRDIPHVQWIVKPHPSSPFYGEDGVTEQLTNAHDHVHLVPEDIKTDSVLRVADAVCTVRGTVGMEALLFGCKVILTGNAFYENIDAVRLCLTEREYVEALQSIQKKEPPTESLKKQALAALYYQKSRFEYVSPTFGLEHPPGIPPEEEREHDRPVIEQAVSFLIENSYNDDPYYRHVKEFLKSGAKRLTILDLNESDDEASRSRIATA